MTARYHRPVAVRAVQPDRWRRLAAARTDVDLRAVRPLGAAMLAAGAVLPHLPSHPGVPCPLRSVTGIPCPFCGSTTAVEAVMGGHPVAALAASPLGVAVVLFVAVSLLRPGRIPTRLPVVPLLVLVVASWVFQLARFHLL
jgi:hypothetical protein